MLWDSELYMSQTVYANTLKLNKCGIMTKPYNFFPTGCICLYAPFTYLAGKTKSPFFSNKRKVDV